MGRRFKDEPINLIHRIPSPEQLDAARPAKATFAHMLSQKGAAFFRSAIEAFSSSLETVRQSESQANQAASGDRFDEPGSDLAPESECRPDRGRARGVEPQEQHGASLSQSAKAAGRPPESVCRDSGVSYEEEIGELRTFLLRQQQDIGRLTEQIQELRAMVLSQQQVLLCFEKESEAMSASFREERVASAVAKGNTLIRIRQKPVANEKAMAEKNSPTRASLNL